MGLEKFTEALDLLKGFDVNLFVGEEVYKGKLLGVESDHVVLETDKKYIFYYRIDKIQAITKNTKDFKTHKSKAHFQQTQSLMALLQSFQNTWVSILSIHKQRFNGVLTEVDSDFVTLINGEERILLKLDYVSNILKGFIKEEEEKEDKGEKAAGQNKGDDSKSDDKEKSDSDKNSEDKKNSGADKTDNKSSKKDAGSDKNKYKSDKQADTHHSEHGKSEKKSKQDHKNSDKKSKQENKETDKHQQVTVVQHSNTTTWSKPIKEDTCEPCQDEASADSTKGKSKSQEKASKGNMEKKAQHENEHKDKQKEEPKMTKPKPVPPHHKEAKEKDKPKQENKHDKQKDAEKAEASQKVKQTKEIVAENNNTSYVWKPISQEKKSLRFAGEPPATNEKKGSVTNEVVKEKAKSQIADKPEHTRAFPFGGESKANDANRSFPFAGEPAQNDTARAFPFAGFPKKVKKTSGFLNF
jgi:hypothetical protein